MQWFSKLMPKQKMQDLGDGCVQAGHVGGDLNNATHHNNLNNSQAVYIFINHEQRVVPPPEPLRSSAVADEVKAQPLPQAVCASGITDDQAYILKVMRYEDELGALAERFMKKQFQTTYVKGLSSHQARRVVLYIYKCAENKNAARQNVNA